MQGITNPAEPFFKDGQWGWDGTVWRKLPMLWGYSDTYGESEENKNTGAEDTSLTFSLVDEGEVWVITNITAFSSHADATVFRIQAVVGGVVRWLTAEANPGAWLTVNWQGQLVLKKDDYVFATFASCHAGNEIYADAIGYKMKIAE